MIGRDERIRTSDPHTPSVMRYQAALRPDRARAYRSPGRRWQVTSDRLVSRCAALTAWARRFRSVDCHAPALLLVARPVTWTSIRWAISPGLENPDRASPHPVLSPDRQLRDRLSP